MSPIERSAGGGGGGGFANPMTTAGDLIYENAVPAPARLAIGSTGQALQVAGGLPAWAYPPGFVLDYVPRVTDFSVTATTAATATTLITGNPVTYDGATQVMIECGSPEIAILTATAEVLLVLWEGATNLCALGTVGQAITTTLSCYGAVVFTPTAGVHTYTIKAWKTTAGSNVTIRGNAVTSGQYAPAWYRITTS